MPHPMPGKGWFEMLFENGKEGSWFDQVDRATAEGDGVVAIAMPINKEPVVVFPCNGSMSAWMEQATIPTDGLEAHGELDMVDREVIMRTNPVVALHIRLRNDQAAVAQ